MDVTKNSTAYHAYLKSLPKKRMAAGAIIRNNQKKVLMVQPSYKDFLEIPGGVVEQNESPLEACRREVREETNLELRVQRLLCVDYTSANETETEGLIFIFYAGDLSSKQLEALHVDGEEISGHQFLSLEEIQSQTEEVLYQRIEKCVEAIERNAFYYLEDQFSLAG